MIMETTAQMKKPVRMDIYLGTVWYFISRGLEMESMELELTKSSNIISSWDGVFENRREDCGIGKAGGDKETSSSSRGIICSFKNSVEVGERRPDNFAEEDLT